MSINLEIDHKQLKEANTLRVHYLPAKINGNGEANVDEYFNNYTQEENGYLINALRGYPLQGEKISVPTNYKAVVFQETREPLTDTTNRVFRMAGTFDDFFYWNYDKIPSKGDAYKKALQITSIAKELAQPLTEDDVLEEIKKRKNGTPVDST